MKGLYKKLVFLSSKFLAPWRRKPNPSGKMLFSVQPREHLLSPRKPFDLVCPDAIMGQRPKDGDRSSSNPFEHLNKSTRRLPGLSLNFARKAEPLGRLRPMKCVEWLAEPKPEDALGLRLRHELSRTLGLEAQPACPCLRRGEMRTIGRFSAPC